jgi:DNA-binding CsgD family transcriptional regulator
VLLLGIVEVGRSNYDAGDALLAESLKLARASDPTFGPMVTYHRGKLAYGRGDIELAKQYLEQALSAGRAVDRLVLVCMCLGWLGMLATDQGAYAEATRAFREVLAVNSSTELGSLRSAPDPGYGGPIVPFTAVLALMTGQPERAVRLLGNSTVIDDLGGEKFFLSLPQHAIFERAVQRAQEALGQAEYDRAWADGRAMSPDQVRAELQAALDAAEEWQELHPTASPAPFGLTPRELAILRLLPSGHSNIQVAEALFISPRTVQTHLSNLYGKLGVSGRAEASAIAVQHGIT